MGECGDGRACSLSVDGGAVVLYVDDRCPFCAEELRRFHVASGGRTPEGMRIVRHAAEGVPHPGVVPHTWADRTVVDPTGAIAEALGVTAVPFLALVDARGRVVEVQLGLTSEESIRRLLDTLATYRSEGDPHD